MAAIMLHHPSIKSHRAGVRSRACGFGYRFRTDFAQLVPRVARPLMCGSPLAEWLNGTS
jgi:hypothetical protein